MKAGNRLLSLLGMIMIGDALASVIGGAKHMQAWRGRPGRRGYNRAVDFFSKNKPATVVAALGEAMAGAAILRRAEA